MPEEKPKFYEAAKFKKLNAEWQKKLKASGFEDLEDPENPDEPIPHHIKTRLPRFKKGEETRDYYDQCLHYLEYGTFDSMRQKAMWTMHCHGESLQEIATSRLISKSTVQYHIRRVRNRMKGGI